MDGLVAFEVRAEHGHVYRLFEDGRIEGFGDGCTVTNRVPSLVRQAHAEKEVELASALAENARLRAKLADATSRASLPSGYLEIFGEHGSSIIGIEAAAARAMTCDQTSRNCQASVGMAMAAPIDDHGEGEG